MRRPALSTWVMLGVAVAAVALAHEDPWAEEGPVAELVSTKSNARRLLPELAARSEEGATIEIRPVAGDVIRIVADGAGHYVEEAGRRIGPADPEAVGGLWASLRMATTVRAADDEDGRIAAAPHGTITVQWTDAEAQLWVGEASPDGAGRYGGRRDAPRGAEGTWVIEQEVGTLLEQSARAWLSHRALVVEPGEVVAMAFDDGLSLQRGEDAAWRSQLSAGLSAGLDATAALLERTAVEHRLLRLASARLDPWVNAEVDTSGPPWVAVVTMDGRTLALWRGGECPGRPGRVVVARGPGLRGCVDAALTTPWPVPGRGLVDDGAMLDGHLVVPDYGRVLRIELTDESAPEEDRARTLARQGGGWRIEQRLAGQDISTQVEESEVYRWFQAAHDAEVELADAPTDASPRVRWSMGLDSGITTELVCEGQGEALRCRREAGPWLRVRSRPPQLRFAADTFVDRGLVDASADDVRAVEIVAGPGGTLARQSAHFDLGVWRLDAPLHPLADAALDEDALQSLMAVAVGARAEQWLSPTEEAPERIVRLELTPQRDRPSTLDLSVWEDCRVAAPGRRPARVSEGACESLRSDLLRRDAGAFVLLGARSVELTLADGTMVRLRDEAGTLSREDEAPLGDEALALDRLRRFRATHVVAGPPPTPSDLQARIRPIRGPEYVLTAGAGWISVAGQAWHYAGDIRDDPEL
jgi:hypothetical protein